MSLISLDLDFTDRDFASLLIRLQKLATSGFPSWTDFTLSSTRNVLLELFAFIGDRLAYYLDQQAREAFIALAELRANIIVHARALGYVPAGPVPARVDVVATIPVNVGDVVIPAESLFRTRSVVNPILFRSTEPTVIESGETSVTITVENSEQAIEVFAVDGGPEIVLALTRRPYIDGSIQIACGNGVYEERDNLFSSTESDLHYYVVVGNDDRATIVFGDGTTGQPPSGTATAIYRYGGGASGTVDANQVTVLETRIVDSLGNVVPVVVTNPAASTPGADRESKDAIKLNAPLSVAAQERSVSNEDFEVHARRVGGVGRALALTYNETTTVPFNTVDLFILPHGGGLATQGLLDEVEELILTRYPPLATVRLRVLAAPLLEVDVRAAIETLKNTVPEDVALAGYRKLVEYFDPDRIPDSSLELPVVDFGHRLRGTTATDSILPWSDPLRIITSTPGIRLIADGNDGLLLNGQRSDVVVAPNQFPVLGSVEIVDAVTGAILLTEG